MHLIHALQSLLGNLQGTNPGGAKPQADMPRMQPAPLEQLLGGGGMKDTPKMPRLSHPTPELLQLLSRSLQRPGLQMPSNLPIGGFQPALPLLEGDYQYAPPNARLGIDNNNFSATRLGF